MKKFKTVSLAEMRDLLVDERTMLLDCRDLKDYRSGNIDNAMHVHEGLKETLLTKGDKNIKLVIYCYYGHVSEHLAEMFGDFGFKHVYSLEGGYAAWKENGAITG
ncbi:rhodanese-like domain-containing protein [Methylomarinum vadi]|uniref:rhodanese-like domain-containing protein n=1 Tax=Methylomarinum vadi TaxID=438855 RepID=UPI0004DF7A6B|nr:rhodanese-like domain-containing protein [Methylomarinum vadi]